MVRFMMGETTMDKILLRVNEAAHILNVSRWTVYRWVEEGRIEATKIGRGSLRIFHQSVSRLIEQSRTGHFGALNRSAGRPELRAIVSGVGKR
jgi:excisionase family DNA binding protein